MLVQAHGETEAGPVVSVLKGVQSVTLEVHLSIEVLLEENFHGNLALAPVFGSVAFAVEVEVVFHGAARVLGLLVLTRGNG